MTWISVEDELPPESVNVWIYDTDAGVLLGHRHPIYGWRDMIEDFDGFGERDTNDVTHWQPWDKPEPPT